MGIVRTNPENVLAFLKRYEHALKPQLSGDNDNVLCLCPFHDDQKQSFSISLSKGVGFCFSCGDKGYTLYDVARRFEPELPPRAIDTMLAKASVFIEEESDKEEPGRPGRPKGDGLRSCGFKVADVEKWHVALLENARELAHIVEKTGWSLETIKKWKIGWSDDSFTIPLICGTTVANVKYYRPDGVPKYRGVEGSNQNRVWPLENINRNQPDVWLMAGEKDCIMACQNGLNAVTFTGGESSIPKLFLKYFQGRNVYICYDIDNAGKSGARKIAEALKHGTSKVRIVSLPEEGLPENGDYTDYVRMAPENAAHVEMIGKLTKIYEADKVGSRVPVPEEVIDTYLEDIIPKRLFYKRIRMRIRVVSAVYTSTYVVPQSVTIECDKEWHKSSCDACPMQMKDGPFEFSIRPDHPELLQIIEGNVKKQREALASLVEIPVACPCFKIKSNTFRSVYPIAIIPALEKDKPFHNYTMQEAWAYDSPAETNEDYMAEAVSLCNPDTQKLTIMCYKLDRDIASLEDYALDPSIVKQLEIFQCQPEPTKYIPDLQKSTTTSPTTSPTSTEDSTSTLPSTLSITAPLPLPLNVDP